MMEKTSNLQKYIQIQSQNKMRKTNGKDDFKNILSNLQHQDHRIVTTNDTFRLPKFPHIKPL